VKAGSENGEETQCFKVSLQSTWSTETTKIYIARIHIVVLIAEAIQE
jgi:hypothetical protein